MNELMQHVERIVRPVRAFQSRKLRMRRELLAHLESALEEERGKDGGDETAALERARARLGEGVELARQLQESVPRWERAVLSAVPGLGAMDVLSRPSCRGRWRDGRIDSLNRLPMALGLLVTGSATTVPVIAFVLVISRIVIYPLFTENWGGYARLVQTGALVFLLLQGWVGVAWMAELLRRNRGNRRRAWVLGVALFAIQLWWVPVVWAVGGLNVKFQLLGSAVGSAVGLLAILALIVRVVEVRLLAYEPWLELDIAR